MQKPVILMMLLALAALSSCVAPRTWESPLAAQPFDSPVTVTAQKIYLPVLMDVAIEPKHNPKKGLSLACGYGDMARMGREVALLGATWIWNWAPQPPLFAGIESVPTIWSVQDIGAQLGGNSEWVLGFNEPDQWDQANLTPEAAAKAWATLEAIYPDRKLTSPQVMQHDRHWLERFVAAYQAQNDGRMPRMDALAIHTYALGGTAADYEAMVTHYIELAQRWQVPEIWVTEFTLSPGLDGTLRSTIDELRTYMDWLAEQPLVTRYSPWTNRTECSAFPPDSFFDTPLFGANGLLTPAGQMYAQQGAN
jgi:hypothetical protein